LYIRNIKKQLSKKAEIWNISIMRKSTGEITAIGKYSSTTILRKEREEEELIGDAVTVTVRCSAAK